MSVTVYDKDGRAYVHTFPIDAKEAVATGEYTFEKPEGENEDISPEEYEKRVLLTERARLGGTITLEERSQLVAHDTPDFPDHVTGIEERYPTDRAPVGAEAEEVQALMSAGPPSTEVADTFNPATADRDQLFAYLRSQGEEPGNRTSTENLREQATQLLSPKNGG